MNLKYRGVAYTTSSQEVTVDFETIEGKYHGIPTKIQLPKNAKSLMSLQELITYRGAKLAI